MKAMEGTAVAFEDAAVIFSDIISALADFVSAYNDSLWEEIDKASKDVEYDRDGKQVCYAPPCTVAHVQRRSVKLWKTNRAIYRPYAWAIVPICPDMDRT